MLAVIGVDGVFGTRFGSGVCAFEYGVCVGVPLAGTSFFAPRFDMEVLSGRRFNGGSRSG